MSPLTRRQFLKLSAMEAALADNPPSKRAYKLASLGVHDHWNNATEKEYGRNLGFSEGIGLIMG